jgi:hypothetical protein
VSIRGGDGIDCGHKCAAKGFKREIRKGIAEEVEIMSSLESVLKEARKLPPEERRELVERLLAESKQPPAASGERALWDKIEERTAQAPPETWEDAPPDGSLNVDHYLYGAPRR